MDSESSQFPCMPTPTMPKRTRSLAATAAGIRLRGSGTSECAASDAPAAAALMPRNSRREQLVSFTASPRHVGGPILRSEERRVGKECRSGWSRDHEKKKKEKESTM